MKPYLLDVNILLALAWPVHVHHRTVLEWLCRHASEFSTCPMTQAGFIRISCNAGYSPVGMKPMEATAMLDRILALDGHRFWPDHLPLAHALRGRNIVGHRQITDAYLIALAEANGGKFATLDRAALSIGAPHIVELVQFS